MKDEWADNEQLNDEQVKDDDTHFSNYKNPSSVEDEKQFDSPQDEIGALSATLSEFQVSWWQTHVSPFDKCSFRGAKVLRSLTRHGLMIP